MDDDDGLIFAVELDGRGGGRPLGWADLAGPPRAPRWLHLNYERPRARRWLDENSGIDPVVVEALCEEETRPRLAPRGDGLLLVLRGVNLNAGADPEDMVSLRLWADDRQLVTVRRRRLLSIQDVREELLGGDGPLGIGGVVVRLSERLIERMAGVLEGIDERVESVEEALDEDHPKRIREELGAVRRAIIALRRHLAPQREVAHRLAAVRLPWLDDSDRAYLQTVAETLNRYVDDLDQAREEARVAQEELSTRLAEQTNRRMYAFSVLAGLFLPLTFVSGLLGMNVAGIPHADDPLAFAIVCGILAGVAGLQLLILRFLRWL